MSSSAHKTEAGATNEPPGPRDAARLEAVAAAILARFGAPFSSVQRAGGWTNAVWLAETLVLRLATGPDNENLAREARLAALLGPATGYPAILATGTSEGLAWSLAERLPGQSLGAAWAGLDWQERVAALAGLWKRAEAVHRVPPAAAAAIARQQAWFNNTDGAEAQAGLARLVEAQILAADQGRRLQAALDRFWPAAAYAPRVLCHGDLTLDNAMWHAGEVAGLLDFEFAVMAPVQLDLNHLVKCAFGPPDADRPPAGEDRTGAERLRAAVRELARPLLVEARERDLLLGQAILLELHLLALWLAHPEGEGPLAQWDPLRRLRSLADGRGGYLAPLLEV